MRLFKSVCVALSVALAGVSLAGLSTEAQAKRLGGGKAAGMQRSTPAATPDQPGTVPAKPGTQPANAVQQPAAAAPTPAAAAGKRSWLGPLAGIAAGLGIAALLSHFGLGGAVADALMTALIVAAVVFAVMWLVRRLRGGAATQAGSPALAGAGAPWPAQTPAGAQTGQSFAQPATAYTGTAQPQPSQQPAAGGGLFASLAGTTAAAAPSTSSAASLPADFDLPGFERIAKMVFVRMQAANDAGDVEDLRKFTTPDLFSSLRMDLMERNGATQQTDVVQLEAQLANLVTEGDQQIASVRFSGLIREEIGGAASAFAEIWHLVRPVNAQEWRIAGIAPIQ